MAMLIALLTTLIAQKGPGRPTVDITCVEGEQAAGDPSKISTATALTGAIGCTDPDAIAYRRTLPESIAGPPLTGGRGGTIDALATINIYGPFEAGFSSDQLICLANNEVQLCSTPDPQPDTNSNPKIAIYLSGPEAEPEPEPKPEPEPEPQIQTRTRTQALTQPRTRSMEASTQRPLSS